MKLWRVILFLFAAALGAEAQNYAVNGACTLGGQATITQGVASSGTRPLKGQTTFTGTGVMASYPGCTVTVYSTGTTVPATIYLTATGSAQSNPFTANLTDGSFVFFAPAGCYDIMISSGATQASTMPNAKTFPGVCAGNTGGGGGGGTTAGTQVTVNGTAAVPNSLNFSNVLLPPSNGSLINFLLSGNTVGAYLAGNGNASNCLSGTGTWVACSGGGGGSATLPTTPQYDLFASTGAGAAQASGVLGNSGFVRAQVYTATGDVTSASPGFQLFPNASVEYFPTGYANSQGNFGALNGLALYMSHSGQNSATGNGGIALGGGNSSGTGNQIYVDCEASPTAGCDFKVPLTVNGAGVGGGGGGGSLPTTPVWDLFASTGAGGAQASGVLGQTGFLRAYVLEATGTGNASPWAVPNGSIEYFPTGGYGAGGANGVALHVSHSNSATGFGGIALAGGNTAGVDQLYLDCEAPPVVPALNCDFKVPVTYLGASIGGGGGAGSGTVASGTALHFAWYAATGTTVSSSSHLDDGAANAGAITSTEPIYAPELDVSGGGGIAMTGTGGTLPTMTAGSGQGGIGIGPGGIPEYSSNGGAWTAISSGGGAQGPPGTAATITVGTTTTGAAGTQASVTNAGTTSAAVFDFTIPQGAAGATGATGAPGATGSPGSTGATGPEGPVGTAATVTVGTTNTLPAGSVATVTNSGTSAAAVLNFGIPEGQPGSAASGISGATTGGGLVVSGTTTQTLGLVTSCSTGQVLQWNGTSWVCAAPGGVTNPILFTSGTPSPVTSEGGFGVISTGNGATPAISLNGAAFVPVPIVQVNGATVATSAGPFRNFTTATPPSNGASITFAQSSSNITAALVGDGSTNCLNGQGHYVACAAGVGTGAVGQFGLYDSTSTIAGTPLLTTDGTTITATAPISGTNLVLTPSSPPTAGTGQVAWSIGGNGQPTVSSNGVAFHGLAPAALVNGSNIAANPTTMNFNGTNANPPVCNPAAPTNGRCITFQLASAPAASISAAIVGDGNVSNCLSGIGTYVPCGGGGGGSGTVGNGTANQFAIYTGTNSIAGTGSLSFDGSYLIANNPFSAGQIILSPTTTLTPIAATNVFAANSSGAPYWSTSGATFQPFVLGPSTACSANQVLRWVSPNWTCYTPTSGTVTGATASGGLLLTGATLGLVTSGCTANMVMQYSGTAWSCQTVTGGGGGSGTVNSGTAGQFAWYSAAGTAVSGSPALSDSGTVINSTEPIALGGGGIDFQFPNFPSTGASVVSGLPQLMVYGSGGSSGSGLYFSNGSTTGGTNVWMRIASAPTVNSTLMNTQAFTLVGTAPNTCNTTGAPANGRCVVFYTAGPNTGSISGSIVGDGNASNCLNGTGNYTPCSGGTSTSSTVTCQPSTDLLAFTTQTNVCALVLPNLGAAKQWIVNCNLIWNRQSTGQSAASTMTAVLTLSAAPTAASYFTTETWASGGPVFGNVNVLTTPLATTFNTASSAQGDTTIWSYVYHGTIMAPAAGLTATFSMQASNGTGLIRLGTFCTGIPAS